MGLGLAKNSHLSTCKHLYFRLAEESICLVVQSVDDQELNRAKLLRPPKLSKLMLTRVLGEKNVAYKDFLCIVRRESVQSVFF